MTEARDQMAARRAAYAWVADAANARLERGCDRGAVPEFESDILNIIHTLEAASLVVDGDLSALEDGDPVPGRCQDKACPGPHGLPSTVCRCGVTGSATTRSGEHCERFGSPAHGAPCSHGIVTGGCYACDNRPHLLPERRKKR